MNKIHSKVWNKALGQWVVASELASGDSAGVTGAAHARPARRSLVWIIAMVLAGLPPAAFADYTNAYGSIIDTSFTLSNGIAIGASAVTPARASDNNGLAIGANATASGADSTALGNYLTASGINSTAVGGQAQALGAQSIVLQNNNNADLMAAGLPDGSQWVAVDSTSAYSIAIGSMSQVVNSTNAIAFGRNARVTSGANGANAIGYGAAVSSIDGSAIGTNASIGATSANSVAIGTAAAVAANAGSSVAIGDAAKANMGNTVAIGSRSTASGSSDVALGNATLASGGQSVAAGDNSRATGIASIAMGSSATASGGNGIAIGVNTMASGPASLAMGVGASAAGSNSIALGSQFTGLGSTGTQSVAIGMNTGRSVSNNRNVAVGSFSGNTVSGYENVVVGYGAGNNVASYATVAIGSRAVVGGNQAIAIGAGAQANGAQSISIGTGNVVSGANSGALGDPSYVSGAGTYTIGNNNGTAADPIAADNAGAFGNNNLMDAAADNSRIVGNGNSTDSADTMIIGNNVSIGTGLNGAVVLGNNSTVSAAADTLGVAINGTTYTFAGGAPADGDVVSVGSVAAPRQIQNVAAGRIGNTSTDAINGSQLHATNQAVTALDGRVDTLGASTASNLGGSSTYDPASGTVSAPTYNITGTGGTANTYNNVGDALTALNQTASAGWNVSAEGANATNVAPGEAVDLNNSDGNIVVSKAATDDNVTFDLADTITVGSVTAGNSILNTSGLTVDDGTNSASYGSTGMTIVGGPSVTATGINAGSTTITNVAPGVNGTDAANVNQVNTAVSGATTAGLNFTGNVATAGDVHRNLGQTLAIRGTATTLGAFSGANLRTVTDPTNGAIQLQMADSPKFGAVTINDAFTGKITGVTAGTADTDAVNVGQLNTVATAADNIDRTAVKYDWTDLDGDGVVDTGEVDYNRVTLNPGGTATTITNLADGAVSATSSDAINGSQLYGASQSVANHLGGGSTVNADGTVSAPAYNITNTGGTANAYNNVGDALTALNQTASAGWTLSADGGTTGDNIGPGETANFAAGSNATVSRSGNTITYGVVADPTFNTVTVGNTRITTSGLTIVGGPSITATGVNAGGNAITNVGNAVNATDAVNLSQLQAAQAMATTHYYSVSDGGVQRSNYNNDGATGDRSLAAGAGAAAAGTYSTAIGSNARATGNASLAAGVAAEAVGNDAVSIGSNAGRGAIDGRSSVSIGSGAGSNANGYWNVAVGSQNAGALVVGNGNVSFGQAANYRTQGSWNTGTGSYAGNNSIGSYNAYNGFYAGAHANGSNNVASGSTAGYWVAGDNNVASGVKAGNGITGSNNVSIGNGAGTASTFTVQTDAFGNLISAFGGIVASDTVAIGNAAVATQDRAIAIGTGAQANGVQSISVGTGNIVNGANSGAFGDPNLINGSGSYAVGNDNTINANNAFVVGNDVTVGTGLDGAVVLGDGSTVSVAVDTPTGTINGITYIYAGGAPADGDVVSVGSATAPRQIQNVAAGQVGATSTDAINGSQLYATNQAVEQVATTSGNTDQTAVKYDWTDLDGDGVVDPGEVDYNRVTLNPGGTPTTVTNVAAGTLSATSTDAVNGSQLYQTNQIVTNLGGSTATHLGGGSTYDPATGTVTAPSYTVNGNTYTNVGDALSASTAHYYSVNDGGTVGGNYNNDGATGLNALASGVDAVASGANAVAIGWDSRATSNNAVAIGGDSTARNGAAVALGGNTFARGLGSIAIGSDLEVEGIQDLVGIGRRIEIEDDSFDVVAIGRDIGGEELSRGVAIGSDIGLQDGISDFIAMGAGANVAVNGGIAIGSGASAGAQAGDVALGVDSTTSAVVATRTGVVNGTTYAYAGANPTSTVSVGAADAERTITNVAAGRVDATSTDAINGSQLHVTNQAVEQVAIASGSTDQTAVKYDWTDLDGDGVVDPGEVNYNSVTLNPGGTPTAITNLADGAVSSTSSDAINGSQLHGAAQSVATNLGGGSVVNADGTVSAPSYNVNGTTYNNVGSALAASTTHYFSVNDNGVAGGNYNNDGATGRNAIAAGVNASSAGQSSVAVGDGATADNFGDVSIGLNAGLLPGGAFNLAIGTQTGTNSTGAWNTAVGNGAFSESAGYVNTALGAASAYQVIGSQNTALGVFSGRQVTGDDNVALGAGAGNGITANATASIGAGSVAGAQDGDVALGSGSTTATVVATPSGTINGVTYGYAGINPTSTVSVGSASAERTITNVAAGRVGSASTDAINGSQLYATNQAVEQVAATSGNTDQTAVKYDWTDLDGDGVVDPGEVNYNRVTLAGTGGTALTNLADGAVSSTSSDAINGSQLHGVSQSIADHLGGDSVVNVDGTVTGPTYTVQGDSYNTVYGAVTAVDGQLTTINNTLATINNGGGIKYFHANSTAPDSQAAGANSVAIGPSAVSSGAGSIAIGDGASANHANSIAFGAGSATTVGAQTGYQGAYVGTSSSTGEANLGGRQVTGVAAGSAATDAVNVSQLNAGVEYAISEANSYTDGRIAEVNTAVTELDNRVTTVEGDVANLQGDVTDIRGDVTELDQRVTNVEGTVENVVATVNQFDQRITEVEGDVTNIANGAEGMFQVSQEAPLSKPQASGTNSLAGGNGAVASGSSAMAVGNQSTASGSNSTALGNGATASAANSAAIGQGATARHANSVALGQGAATTVGAQSNYNAAYVGSSSSAGEVNVGGRTVTGVAAGIAGTDAVNVNQLNGGVNYAINQANTYTDNRFGQLQSDVWTMQREFRGGTASAMAMAGLPQAYLPGKSMLSVAAGGYQGEYGMAVGLSGITENGRWVYKAQATGNTTRDWGFSVGAGIQW